MAENKVLKTLTLPNSAGEHVTYELHPEWANIENKPTDLATESFVQENVAQKSQVQIITWEEND